MGLKINIKGLRFRASDRKLNTADRLRIIGQRLSKPAVIRLRAGDNLADLAKILSQRQPLDLEISTVGIDAMSETVVAQIERPEMIDDSRLPFRVAKGVVPGTLSNGRKVAAEINEQNPDSAIRIPTEPELLELNRLLGNQLEGTEYWIWTETEHKEHPGQFVLRHLSDADRLYYSPGLRRNHYAVRFVEDLPDRADC